MSINNHVMTNTDTGSIIYFIDLVINNTLYSIDILTYPVPTSLPDGFNFLIIFSSVAKNPNFKLPSGINDILGYNASFQLMLAVKFKPIIQPKPLMYLLIICINCIQPSLKLTFNFRYFVCYFSFCFKRFFNC